MKNIVLARVDDRLIHGEVVTVWSPTFSVTEIVIVDDSVNQDPFNKRVIKLLAPSGVNVEVFDIVTGAEYLKGDTGKDKVLVLAKNPITYENLINKGVDIKEVNLGGMGINNDRKPFIKNVACSEEELNSIRRMIDKGVYVYYQLVPEQRAIDASTQL